MFDTDTCVVFSAKTTVIRFKGSGGVVRGLDSVGRANICAQEMTSAVSRGLQGASRGLPTTTGQSNMYVWFHNLLMKRLENHWNVYVFFVAGWIVFSRGEVLQPHWRPRTKLLPKVPQT